jgi:hypothetical protein
MSFSVRSSIVAQADCMRRISRLRAIRDNSSATIAPIGPIHRPQYRKLMGARSALSLVGAAIALADP